MIGNILEKTMRHVVQETYDLSTKMIVNPASLEWEYFQIQFSGSTSEIEKVRAQVLAQLETVLDLDGEEFENEMNFQREIIIKNRKEAINGCDYWVDKLKMAYFNHWEYNTIASWPHYDLQISTLDLAIRFQEIKQALKNIKELTLHPK